MIAKVFRIGPGFGFPGTAETVTQTYALLGKRGAGKTTTAAVITEELLKGHAQVIVLDPLDGWFGLRLTADGKGPGFPIHVFGGIHGDLPLEAGAGALMADVVVDEGLSLVLSLAQFSKGDMRRFVTDFCERLYRRKNEPEHRTPLHVVMDEADLFVPQERHHGLERLLGAVADLYLRGRSRGIGGMLITQRPARIHKDALSEVEVLICHRLISPQDRKAVEAWIEAHDVLGQRREFMESLAGLPVGTAWFWSPGWLDVFQRVKVRARETFDSSATPTGAAPKVAKTKLAAVDLERLRTMMAATIERVKQEDPRELRRQLAESKAELLRVKKDMTASHKTVDWKEKVLVLKPGQLTGLRTALARMETLAKRIMEATHGLDPMRAKLQQIASEFTRAANTVQAGAREAGLSRAQRGAYVDTGHAEQGMDNLRPWPREKPRQKPANLPSAELPRQAQAMLEELGRRHPAQLSQVQLATLSGYSRKSSQFQPNLRKLTTGGYVEVCDGLLVVTERGLSQANVVGEIPMTPEQTLAMWFSKLPKQPAELLRVLWEVRPRQLTEDELAAKTTYSTGSSQWGPSVRMLLRHGLIVKYEPDTLGISEEAFG